MRALPRFIAISAIVMLAAGGVASAGPGGGGHGGGFGGGHGGGFGGGHGGGWHGGGYGGWHGGGYGGWRGGYGGWRGGYGWRGGWYGRYGWCCGWGGWGWGWGLGLYLPFLPWYYDTYWWNGMPYYYADGNYYLWDNDIGEYEAVEPPSGLSSTPPQGPSRSAGQPAVSAELFAYPKGGQSEAQQKQDKEECSRWAASETGFNPPQPSAGTGQRAGQEDYLRAEAACLQGRNYSVR